MVLEEPLIDDQNLTSELISTNCKEIDIILDESQNLEFKSSVWYPYEPPSNLSPSEITKEINEATIKTISGFLNSEKALSSIESEILVSIHS